MALTAAEKQKRYRAKVKQDPEREAELKRRHRLRYHSKKKLVKDMTERKHRNVKRRWKLANKKRREKQKALHNVFPDLRNTLLLPLQTRFRFEEESK